MGAERKDVMPETHYRIIVWSGRRPIICFRLSVEILVKEKQDP